MFEQLWQSWVKALTVPKVETFDEEQRQATIEKAVVGMAIAGVAAGILGALVALASGDVGAAIVSIIGGPIFAVIGLFIMSGILFIVAKVLGGTGDFVVQTYLVSIIYAPINIVRGIPFVGSVVGGLASLYALYPLTFALQSVHKVPTGKAVLIWLIPGAILLVLGLCAAIVLGAAFLAALGAGAR